MHKHLQEFAAILGWPELIGYQHRVDSPSSNYHGRLVKWYESGSLERLLFQINEQPCLCAAVFALRYRICSGWHAFDYSTRSSRIRAEAARLAPWLARCNFDGVNARRAFRIQHPECSNYSLKRVRDCGLPFDGLKRAH